MAFYSRDPYLFTNFRDADLSISGSDTQSINQFVQSKNFFLPVMICERLKFETLDEYEEYVHWLVSTNQPIPDDLITEDELKQLRSDQEERKVYYGLRSDSESEYDFSGSDGSDSECDSDGDVCPEDPDGVTLN